MKSHFKSVLLIFSIILTTGCFGLSQKESGVDKDYLKMQDRAAKAQKEIKLNTDRVTEKSKTLVHGAGYAINLETNKTPPVQVAGELISHAQLTLGNPSLADAKKIEDIVDGLVQEVKAENIKLKIQNTTNKLELDILKTELKKADSEGKAARQKLNTFEEQITKLQNNEELLKKKYEGELDKLNKENLDNAEKAKNWDAEHGVLASLNPFTDLFSFIKKLFTLSIVCGVLFIAFRVLEIFIPSLSILSSIGSMIIGVVKKILPGAIQGAGLVGKSVLNTLSQVVQSNQSFMSTLKNMPIEDELIEKYPEDYKFNKKEVKELLLALTDKTLAELQKELDKNLNEETRGVVSYVKAASGIKAEKPVTSLI